MINKESTITFFIEEQTIETTLEKLGLTHEELDNMPLDDIIERIITLGICSLSNQVNYDFSIDCCLEGEEELNQ